MSAIRHNDRRRKRSTQSSPYSRPSSAPKKSGWSFSGLLSFFNPLRSTPSVEEESEEESSEESDSADENRNPGPAPAQALSMRGHQLAQNATMDPPPRSQHQPNSQSHGTPDSARSSPAKNIEMVTNFLNGKGGQPLNQFELQGIMAALQDGVEDKPEPFRFSASPSTPTRGNSPYASSSSVPFPTTASPSPRKTLQRNPNGVYKWQGGGSSRPRNRYQSPAFGTPSTSRSEPVRLKLAPATPKTDTKRRRVGETPETSTPQRVPAPSPTPPPAPAPAHAPAPVVTPKANGFRPSVHPVPVHPSPLRQAWGQSDSPPQTTPTKAAAFMTDLIKEVTPPKRPDLANPYQTASPVKPPPKKTPVTRKTRASSRIPVKEKEKEKEKEEPAPTPQAIIEATMPKGSKRSRPPPNLEKTRKSPRNPPSDLPVPNGTNGTSRHTKAAPVEVEEVPDDEAPPVPKKQKKATVNGIGRPSVIPRPSISVEELDDDIVMTSSSSKSAEPLVARPTEIVEPSSSNGAAKSTSPTTNGLSFGASGSGSSAPGKLPLFGAVKSSAPKEPSKLRFSYKADKPETPAVPAPPPTQPEPSTSTSQKRSPQEAALAEPVSSLPFSSTVFSISCTVVERNRDIEAALKASTSSLPMFDFTNLSNSGRNGFNFTAAGMKAPAAPASSTWTCDVCMLSNPASATEKCTVCESPKNKPAAAPAPAFDFAAAGMKVPSKPKGSEWTCGICMCSNPATAQEKCTVCESPR
ncbi:hypothetical protein PLICRDRAFT_42829 [Plicaturopsis crispa FD-325 SS-3]|nr:hypothetical protein PLICRDRAFT_42829 [Plicaturopsis crispa FD-325 SS-3]